MQAHSKTYYNDIGLKLIQKTLGLKYLHYGYFEDGIPVNIEGLKIAQQKYTEKILAHIPQEVKTILDVGCGAGGNAAAMVEKGYEVNCVDPDPYLLSKTLEATHGKVKTFQGMYENAQIDQLQPVDLLLMSESCQYINPEIGFQKHQSRVRQGGYVMAVDFFITKEIDKNYLSKSGHKYQQFLDTAKKYGFELVKAEDITKQTAPTMEIYQDIILNKIFPVFEAVFEFIERRFNFIYKILRYFLKDKVEHLKKKYSNQDAKTFSEYKTYYLLLFKKV